MPLPNSTITPIPAIDPATNQAPNATPDLFNSRYLEIDANLAYTDGEIEAAKEAIKSAGGRIDETNQAITEQASRITSIENDSAGSVASALRLDWEYKSGMKFALELFYDSWTLLPSTNAVVTDAVAGDDSLDVDNSSVLSVGQEYALFGNDNAETVKITAILTSTRVRIESNLLHNYSGANLKRCSWSLPGAKAVTREAGVYFTGDINMGSENQDKAVVIRRDDNDTVLRLYYQDPTHSAWTEVLWGWRRTVDGTTIDEEYIVPARGIFRLKIASYLASDPAAEIRHIAITSGPTNLGGVHHPPVTPTIVSPVDGATGIDEQPSLTTSAYSHSTGVALLSTEIQISTEAGFATGDIIDTGVVAGVAWSPSKGKLSVSTTYYVRARHRDVLGGLSAWSPGVSFTTSASFVTVNKPTGTAPGDGDELSSPDGLTLVSSAFSTEGGTDTHANSQWQIATDPAFASVIHDSGANTTNKTSYPVPDGTLSRDNTYYWRVRHEGTTEGWSDWSVPVMFSVAAFTPFVTSINGSNGHVQFKAVTIDESGNIYATGYEESTTNTNEGLVIKFAPDGTITWQKKLGDASEPELFNAVVTDASGNAYVAGYKKEGSGIFTAFLAKFASDGSPTWQKGLGGTGNDFFTAVTTDTDGNIYAAGYEDSSVGNEEALLAKFAPNGELVWKKRLGGSNSEKFYGVAVDASGNVIAAGYESTSGAGYSAALLVKFASDGSPTWQKKLGSAKNEKFLAVAVDASGNIYAGGWESITTGGTVDQCLVAKFASDGTLIWQKNLGGTKHNYIHGVSTDAAGNVYVTGREESSTSGSHTEALVAKFASDGSPTWQKKLGSMNGDFFYGVEVGASGIVYIAGYMYDSVIGRQIGLLVSMDANASGASGTIPDMTLLSWGDPGLTVSDPGLTPGPISLSVNDPTLSLSTPTLAVSDLSFTQTRSEY